MIGTQAGDADTGVQAQRFALIVEDPSRPDLLQQAFGETKRRFLILADEHDEFITAPASDDVLGAGDTAAAGGKGLEGAIADMVTMGIVDGLEAIDIEQQQRDPAASPLRPGDLAFRQRSELELKVPHAQTRETMEEGRLMFQT